MRNGYSFLYLLIFFMFISMIIRVFWPVILVLLIVIIIYYLYIRYKITKEINKQAQQINENYEYNSWADQAENIKEKDVIDVEYTERKENE